MQLIVPDEELAEFPEPPLPKAKQTKYPSQDKLSFIIPKGAKGPSSCVKHHSTLCKVCPLIKRAHKHQLKQSQYNKSCKSLKIHVGDPLLHDDNLVIHANDPAKSVGNPPNLSIEAVAQESISTTLIHVHDPVAPNDNLKIHLDNPPVSLHTPPLPNSPAPQPAPLPLPNFSFTCTFCGCCTCTREQRSFGTQTTLIDRRQRRRPPISPFVKRPFPLVPPRP